MDIGKRIEKKRLEAAILQAQSAIANYELQQEEFHQNIERISVQIELQKKTIEDNNLKLSQFTQ
jgi:multidrug resistance efflux pump